MDIYDHTLLNLYILVKELPKTGKRGRSKKPKIVPLDDLKYAQVVKTRKGGLLEKVERKISFGEEIEQNKISTTLPERQKIHFQAMSN